MEKHISHNESNSEEITAETVQAALPMKHALWHNMWQSGNIPFHKPKVNRDLVKYVERNEGLAQNVFVPLCGKSKDMAWLARRDYHVYGVEISPIAIEQFFKENKIKFENCLLYTSPSPRDRTRSRMPSSA